MAIIPLNPRTRPASPLIKAQMLSMLDLYDQVSVDMGRYEHQDAASRVMETVYLIEAHGLRGGDALAAIGRTCRFLRG